MEVRVHFVDENRSGMGDKPTSVTFPDQVLMPVDYYDVSQDVNKHRQCGTIAFAHIGERQSNVHRISEPKPLRVHATDPQAIPQELII